MRDFFDHRYQDDDYWAYMADEKYERQVEGELEREWEKNHGSDYDKFIAHDVSHDY